jgi:hypothetical protein
MTCTTKGLWRDRVAGQIAVHAAIAESEAPAFVLLRIPVHLDEPFDQIDDRLLGYAESRVHTCLHPSSPMAHSHRALTASFCCEVTCRPKRRFRNSIEI